MRIDSRKGATMNLNLSDWDWLNAGLGVLFLYRGIRDLYNGTGTGWSSEDEKQHFHRSFGILSILCGALYLALGCGVGKLMVMASSSPAANSCGSDAAPRGRTSTFDSSCSQIFCAA